MNSVSSPHLEVMDRQERRSFYNTPSENNPLPLGVPHSDIIDNRRIPADIHPNTSTTPVSDMNQKRVNPDKLPHQISGQKTPSEIPSFRASKSSAYNPAEMRWPGKRSRNRGTSYHKSAGGRPLPSLQSPSASRGKVLSNGEDSPRAILSAIEYVRAECDKLLGKFDEVISEVMVRKQRRVEKKYGQAAKTSQPIPISESSQQFDKTRPTFLRRFTDTGSRSTRSVVSCAEPLDLSGRSPEVLSISPPSSPPAISRDGLRMSRSFDDLQESYGESTSVLQSDADGASIEDMQARRKLVEDTCNRQIGLLMAKLEEVQR